MNIRRLTAVLLAAAALLPLSAARAQFPGPGSTQGQMQQQDPSIPPLVNMDPPAPDAALPHSSARLQPGQFTDAMTAAARRFPRPLGWTGHTSPAAESLPVSPASIQIRLYGAEELRGVVEARIATQRGLFYVLDTPTGAQIIPASAITEASQPSVSITGLPLPNAPIPAPGPNFFAGLNEGMLARQAQAARARATAEDRAARAAASSERARALQAYAHSYPGWTHSQGTYRPAVSNHSAVSRQSVRSYSRNVDSYPRPATGGGFGAGPGDSGGHDYARAIGAADDPVLSTGWTSGHGNRTVHVRDYYRHNKNGTISHVHSHYRSHR